MKLPIQIAQRYLFSKKKRTVINVISWISVAGIAIGTIALIVVLSVYNGFGKVTQSLFNVFDPELMVESAEGKTFHLEQIPNYDAIFSNGMQVSQIVEENAWITHKHNDAIIQLRGVDENYATLTGLDTMLYEGEYLLSQELEPVETEATEDDDDFIAPPQRINYLILGGNVAQNLGVNSMTNSPLSVHIPRRGEGIGMTMEDAFNSGYGYPAAIFYLQEELDNKFVVTDINFVRQLMDYDDDEVTSLAIKVDNNRHLSKIKHQLQNQLGERFSVKDRFDQQPLYFKVFKSERLGVFLILSLIVLIATLNLIASLSLLIIDKRKDIATLRSMGMAENDIRKTFFIEGLLIALVGVAIGLVSGFAICAIQQEFGIVKMGSNFVIDHFPVAMRVMDFIATFAMVSILSLVAVTFTIKKTKME